VEPARLFEARMFFFIARMSDSPFGLEVENFFAGFSEMKKVPFYTYCFLAAMYVFPISTCPSPKMGEKSF